MIENKYNNKINILSILLAFYFITSPLEDILNFKLGTLSKILAIGIVFMIVLLMVKYRINIGEKKALTILMISLIFIYWLSLLWSKDRGVAYQMATTYSLLSLMFIVISLYNFNHFDLKVVELSIVFSGLVIFAFMVFNNGIEIERFKLTEESDPNNLAAFMILPTFVIINSLFKTKNYKILKVIILMIFIFIILLTGSRGAFISIIFGIVFELLINRRLKKQTVFLSVFLIFILYFIFKLILPVDLFERVFSITSYQNDIRIDGSRAHIWNTIFQYVIPEMPFYGFGTGNAPIELIPYYGYAYGVHNTYLTFFLEYGSIGFILIIVFFITLFYQTNKYSRQTLYLSLLITIFGVIFFLDSFPKKYMWNVFIFIMIVNNYNKGGLK